MSVSENNVASAPATKPVAKKASAKAVVRPAAKVVTKPAAKASAPTPAPAARPALAKKAIAVKDEKPKKVKMVRDSFTMPKPEFAVLDTLKARALQLKAPVKKTELIRAGIKALAAMTDASFLAAVRAVPNLKTGRPAKGR